MSDPWPPPGGDWAGGTPDPDGTRWCHEPNVGWSHDTRTPFAEGARLEVLDAEATLYAVDGNRDHDGGAR